MRGGLLLLCLFPLVRLRRSSSYSRDGPAFTRKNGRFCYSCMSMEYKKHWAHLSKFYRPQRNFTEDCVGMTMANRIPTVPCYRSRCVSLFEPRYLAGHFMGENVVRGCLEDVFQVAFNQRLLVSRHIYPGARFCKQTTASELFPSRGERRRRISRLRPLNFCACHGNRCNWRAGKGHAPSLSPPKTLLIFIAALCISLRNILIAHPSDYL